MNQQTVDQVAPGGVVNLSDAPAALDDAMFDSLFPAEPTPVVVAPAPEPAAASPAVDTQTPDGQPNGPFLKGNTSVYNTPEAAVEGLNQKDALIENLRQRYALTTGVDPITGQPVATVAQPQTRPTDYYDSPDLYIKAASDAIQKGSPEAYRDAQAKFMLDTLKPLQPFLQRAVREQAVETVSQEIKEVGSFIGSDSYKQTLAQIPELRDAINIAETDQRFYGRLPGLYKMAYLTGQGRQLPELLKAQAAQAAKQTPPVPVRQTLNPTTTAMPQQTARPTFKTIEGIRATIAEAESRGAKLDF
jgi:hypothetical protein